MKFGVIVFPGSNCDHDAYHALGHVLGASVEFLWHKERELKGVDAVVVPGGFSYGDYLRCGALARFSPVMEEVGRFAEGGGKVLGICNGFQILTEARLLPGILLQNSSRKFICKTVALEVVNAQTAFTRAFSPSESIRIPIAHADGRYFIDDDGLKRIEGEGQVVFRYKQECNGARNNIAGIVNARGNVMGMMPHPERASEALLGNTDGRRVFESLLGS